MIVRERQMGFGGGRKPVAAGYWIVGLIISVTIGSLAASAMMVGTNDAVRKAIVGRSILGGNRPTP
jgi:hypothetical protein